MFFVIDLHSSLCTLLGILFPPSVFNVAPSMLISSLQPYDKILTQIQAIPIDHSYSLTPMS